MSWEILGMVGLLLVYAAIIAGTILAAARALRPWADRVEAKHRSRWG